MSCIRGSYDPPSDDTERGRSGRPESRCGGRRRDSLRATDVNGNVTEAHYLILNQTYEITNSPSFTMPQSGANGVWPYGTVGKGLAAIAAGASGRTEKKSKSVAAVFKI
ncbi:MAG: hypothetical protein ACLUOI_11330 [Eisenbergiella sp.]